MVTIGVDPHKETHSAVAVDGLGRQLSKGTESAVQDGFGQLPVWARALDHEHAWVLEDCRHVSGPFERFLIDHGETVVRLPPRLMAGARDSVRQPGKSDPIDALAIVRAALREGIETLPTARLAGPELEIRLLWPTSSAGNCTTSGPAGTRHGPGCAVRPPSSRSPGA